MLDAEKVDLPIPRLDEIIIDEYLLSNTLHYTYSAHLICKNSNFDHYFTSMYLLWDKDNKTIKREYPLYSDILNANWVNALSEYNKGPWKTLTDFANGDRPDSHPRPIEHYNFVMHELSKKLLFTDEESKLLHDKMIKWQAIYDDSYYDSIDKFNNRFKATFKTIRKNELFIENGYGHYGLRFKKV
jgi:hypothetical protein